MNNTQLCFPKIVVAKIYEIIAVHNKISSADFKGILVFASQVQLSMI